MNNEKEIERMAIEQIIRDEFIEWLNVAGCIPQGTTYWCECMGCIEDSAAKLVSAGIGDKKQAVKEFAEKKVKPLIDELVELMFNDYESHCKVENCEKPDDIPCGCSICVEENKQLWESKIDDLFTELYGADDQ